MRVRSTAILMGAFLGAGCAELTAPGRGAPFDTVAAGVDSHFTCGIRADSTVVCWGQSQVGQTGPTTGTARCLQGACRPEPTPLPTTLRFEAVSVGTDHACGLAAGRAYCWGDNSAAQLGATTGQECGIRCSTAPVPVAGDHEFVAISAGFLHSCALTASGEVYCWGIGGNGQLGSPCSTGPDCRSPIPVRARGPALRAISAGHLHTCGLGVDGAAYCWGTGASGQLGTGEAVNVDEPRVVAGGLRFRAISAGRDHTCGVAEDGRAFCWGEGSSGQLGTGDREPRRMPAAVASRVPFASIAAGSRFTCAVATTGAAYCWGANDAGQLGTGSMGAADRPVAVARGFRFREVSTGAEHACGVTDRYGAVCWGSNAFGQLGDGSTTDRLVPRPTRR